MAFRGCRGLVPQACAATMSTGCSTALAGLAASAQARRMNVNPNQQQRNTQEFINAPKMTDYDIDKEKWGKQTKWHTMDCIIDPDISIPKFWSIAGLKRYWKLFLQNKKILERRPGFDAKIELRDVYLDYKTTCATPMGNQQKELCRVTTWTEAVRIEKDTRKFQLEVEEREAVRSGRASATSWKDMAVKKTSAGSVSAAAAAAKARKEAAVRKATGQPAPKKEEKPAEKPAAKKASAEGDDGKKKNAAGAGSSESDEIVPDVTTQLMELKVENFELVNSYIGQMTAEDWVQITCKVVGKMRTPKTAPLYESFVEYPVFEVALGDGVLAANTKPFIVVAVMDRDGSRFGKDGSDAAQLRKNLGQVKKQSWFT